MKFFFKLLALTFVCIAQAEERPNIVFILADDLGIADIAAYASHFTGKDTSELYYETPNMDRLVGKGIAFSQAYANQLCSPTRAAILLLSRSPLPSLHWPSLPEEADLSPASAVV